MYTYTLLNVYSNLRHWPHTLLYSHDEREFYFKYMYIPFKYTVTLRNARDRRTYTDTHTQWQHKKKIRRDLCRGNNVVVVVVGGWVEIDIENLCRVRKTNHNNNEAREWTLCGISCVYRAHEK